MAQPSFRTGNTLRDLPATKDRIAWLLTNQLSAASRTAGLQTVPAPPVRLHPSLLITPDVAVGRFRGTFDVTLIADVTPPGIDADARAAHYAEAGINWYLRAEPGFTTCSTVTLHLLRREGTTFTRHTTARPGQTLTSREPFPLTVSTTALLT